MSELVTIAAGAAVGVLTALALKAGAAGLAWYAARAKRAARRREAAAALERLRQERFAEWRRAGADGVGRPRPAVAIRHHGETGALPPVLDELAINLQALQRGSAP